MAALVRSGRKLFAERGYEGASVRAITAEAGVNLGAITYHFGSKRKLYEVVVAASLSPLAAAVVAAARGPGSALDRIEAVIRAYFVHLGGHPDAAQLVLKEIVAGRNVPESAAATFQANLRVLVGLVREGQADGSVRSADPVLLALSIVSQPIYLTVGRRIVQAASGLEQEDAATRRRMLDHAVAFVRAALAAKPEGRA